MSNEQPHYTTRLLTGCSVKVQGKDVFLYTRSVAPKPRNSEKPMVYHRKFRMTEEQARAMFREFQRVHANVT